jgi:hypothetical protein
MNILITCCERSALEGPRAVNTTCPGHIPGGSSCSPSATMQPGLPMMYQAPNAVYRYVYLQ